MCTLPRSRRVRLKSRELVAAEEISSSKHQVPKNLQAPSPKNRSCHAWSLVLRFGISLEVGTWKLEIARGVTAWRLRPAMLPAQANQNLGKSPPAPAPHPVARRKMD